jgi:hypothetical protein
MRPRHAAGMNVGTAGMLSALESSVKFVLDAAPVYLVFQSRAPGNNWTPDSLTYSYIVDEHGKYKFANFSSLDDLDEFLQDSALFDKSFLKSSPSAQSPSRPVPNLR